MAVRDLEAFMRQSAAAYDSTLDTTPGSPYDVQVIQPLLQRIGIDPFTVDLETFLVSRLQQAYPLMATGEGDNITDLLIKPNTLLWDPIVREIGRVKRNLSFQNPETLTNDEADSLGGNFFVPRQRGSFSKGTGRIYFSTPQQITITQNNFVTAQGGLVYFPTGIQSIRSQEMLLNIDASGLYYFDVSLIASNPGQAYDIDPNQLVAIANLPSAARVSNLARFQGGTDEESPTDYAARLNQSLGEKSLVTLRGIAAKLLEAFPNINRLNAIGFGDPEMQRDIIEGGGTGPILASGTAGAAISDGQAGYRTTYFSTTEANFDELVGNQTDFVLTVFGAVPGTAAAVDLNIVAVIDANTVKVATSDLVLAKTNIPWTLRQQSLTISGIPGGILYPNTPNGTLTIPNGTVHIGGTVDTYIRESNLDSSTMTLQSVIDDSPALTGIDLLVTDNTGGGVANTTLIELADYRLNANFTIGDATDLALSEAEYDGYVITLLNGPNAGAYRVLEYFPPTTPGNSPSLRLAASLAVTTLVPAQWKLSEAITINLVEPKNTHISGNDLVLLQGTSIVTTEGGVNFNDFNISKGDTLRVEDGPNVGDYTLLADPLAPGFDRLQLDRTLPFSSSDTKYTIFTSSGAGLQPPFVRIDTVQILDSTTQPQGSYVPYAKPVDVQSNSFQSPARGVKHDFREVRVGLVSLPANEFTGLYSITAANNTLTFYFGSLPTPTVGITIPSGSYTVASLVDTLNSILLTATGGVFPDVTVQLTNLLFGVRPVGNGFVAIIGGTAMATLFGTDVHTTADVRTSESDSTPGYWDALSPAIDFYDALDAMQIIDGRNVGFYSSPFLSDAVFPGVPTSLALMVGEDFASIQAGKGTYFAPDSHRHVLIGARSIGSVRVYFLEPTTFEVNENTVFSLDTGATGIANFVPDPTMEYQQVPPLPGGIEPSDGASTTGDDVFSSASQDFLLSGINIGDKLYIDTDPLTGTVALTGSYVSNLAGTTFIYSINDGPDRTVVFVHDDPTLLPDQVTVQGVLNQLNASMGVDAASFNSSYQLMFSTPYPLVIRATGTSLPYILGNVLGYTGPKAFSDSDTSNESPHYLDSGYEILAVGQTTLGVYPPFASSDPNWAAAVSNETFRVTRVGVQRICTTQMASQQAEASLYYFDVQLVSQGTGTFWDISANQQMTVTGYKSDGYYLTVADPDMTFSPLEKPFMVLSRTILEQGVDDDPRNATQLTGQSLQIDYDSSSVVEDVQNFIMSETERVVCSSPLSRHLIPNFVRFDMTYYGGSTEDIVSSDVQKYIRNIYPMDGLSASQLITIAANRGATKITTPITMLSIVHYFDRHVYAQRSQDTLITGRLSAFIPDILNITRSLTSTGL